MDHLLNDTSALVTGGTSGTGLEVAALLAESGVRSIIINGRDGERGEAARLAVLRRAPHASVTFVQADVSSPDEVKTLFGKAAQVARPLGILVNSAGGDYAPELFHRTPPQSFEAIVRHSLIATMYCCHAALPLMERGSAIVNVASDAARVPTPGETVIGAALAGIAMFSRTLAMEAKRQGIRVNVVTPSLIAGTRTYDRITAGGFSKKLFDKAIAAAHLGLATPRDVAEMIVFLAGPRAARVTGQVISVNGGISA